MLEEETSFRLDMDSRGTVTTSKTTFGMFIKEIVVVTLTNFGEHRCPGYEQCQGELHRGQMAILSCEVQVEDY